MLPINLVGQGIVAHAIAALWPDDIDWDIPSPDILLPPRPLLIHASNHWLWQYIDIPKHSLNHCALYEQKLGHIHTWHSEDFAMEYFGWMVQPTDLLQALYARAICRRTQVAPKYTCVATGYNLPGHIDYIQKNGQGFSTQAQIPSHYQEHTLCLTWESDGSTSATLPCGTSGMTIITSPSSSLTDACSYYRIFPHPDYCGLGDSLFAVPPTLASGFNTLLHIIYKQIQNPMSWKNFKHYAEKKASTIFAQSQYYHKILEHPTARGFLTSAAKNTTIMRYIIDRILYGY